MSRTMALLPVLVVQAFLLAVPLSATPALSGESCPAPQKLPREPLTILRPSGESRFTVEVAATVEARATGLMCRTVLAPDHGMLFVYPHPQIARMWMKNTPLSLDILFATAEGRIVKIAPYTMPGSLEHISPDVPVVWVLELAAGSVARHGIRLGDRLRRLPSPQQEGSS